MEEDIKLFTSCHVSWDWYHLFHSRIKVNQQLLNNMESLNTKSFCCAFIIIYLRISTTLQASLNFASICAFPVFMIEWNEIRVYFEEKSISDRSSRLEREREIHLKTFSLI